MGLLRLLLCPAWRVDFVIKLNSFEPQVQGVRALIDFALTSALPEPPKLVFESSMGALQSKSLPPAPSPLFHLLLSNTQTLRLKSSFQKIRPTPHMLWGQATPNRSGSQSRSYSRQRRRRPSIRSSRDSARFAEDPMARGTRTSGSRRWCRALSLWVASPTTPT